MIRSPGHGFSPWLFLIIGVGSSRIRVEWIAISMPMMGGAYGGEDRERRAWSGERRHRVRSGRADDRHRAARHAHEPQHHPRRHGPGPVRHDVRRGERVRFDVVGLVGEEHRG